MNGETSAVDEFLSMHFTVRAHKANRAQLYHRADTSPLVITDTFLLMSLIPAAQCFLKFVGNFLTSNNATTLEKRSTNSSERELLEIFRSSVNPGSKRLHQDWEPILNCRMLRSTSLQNFSVGHFNFYPLDTSLDPSQDNTCSEKGLIDNHQQTISVMEDSLKLYEHDVTYLENNIEALRNKSQESDKLIHELERNVTRLNKLLELKKSELADSNRKVHNYHKYYCWSLVQIANLMKEENTLRDENINLLLLMEECCSDNEYCEDKLKEYQKKLNQIEKEMSELTMDIQTRKKQFQEERNKSCDEICQLKTERESLKVQCEVHQSEVKKCQQMMDLYKKRIDQIKHLVDTKSYEISNLEKSITQLEDQLCEVQKDKVSVLNDLQTARNKNEELTTMTKTLTDKILILESSLKESKAQTFTLCETVNSLQEELKYSEEENRQLKLSLNRLDDEMNSKKVSYENELKLKAAEMEKERKKAARNELELKEQLEHAIEELEQSKGNDDSFRTELEMLKTELKCRNELTKAMEDQHHRLNLSYEALYKEFSHTMDELKERKEELTQLMETMTNMKEENKVLKDIEVTFKSREQKLEQVVQEKLKSFESEILHKEEKISTLEELTGNYVAQMEKIRQDIQNKNEEIAKLNKKISHLENDRVITNNISIEQEKKESSSLVNAQEILSLLEINSAHCKRYHALEKAYKELSLECSALQHNISMSPRISNCNELSTAECNFHESQIRKLTEENRYLNSTLADYKRINGLLLDQIKVSVDHPVLEDSLPLPSIINIRYDTPEKDTNSTLSVEDRNTVDLWWENEVSIPPTIPHSMILTETKSL